MNAIHFVWVPPPFGYVKVNVFECVTEPPLHNGNSNSVGLVMRDHNGTFIWGETGAVQGLSHFQCQLWAVHKGIKETYRRGFTNICVETEHVESFRILKRQNFEEAEQEGLVDVIQAINAYNPLSSGDYDPICRVYPILEERNMVARHVAQYGLEHCEALVEIDPSLPGLQDLLDKDIGWGPNIPSLQALPNYGLGEIVQGPKPKKRKKEVIEEAAYRSILELTQKVARLEHLVDNQLMFMGSKDEAFSLLANPEFAYKAAQSKISKVAEA